MTTRGRIAMVAACLCASLFGGMIMSLLLRRSGEAHAAPAPSHDKEVKAEKFVLVTPKGDLRGIMTCDKKGLPLFAFFDADGKMRYMTACTGDGSPTVALLDKAETPVLALNMTADNTGIVLSDVNGRMRGSFLISKDGNGNFALADKNGKMRYTAALGNDGAPTLVMGDEKEKPLVVLSLAKSGTGLVLSDFKGTTRGALILTDSGEAHLQFFDESGNQIKE